MLTRRFFIGAMAAIKFAPAVQAQDAPVYFATGGAAMAGYDPVSYFVDDAPVLGHAEHSLMWKGVEWHFASAENQERFERDPRAFAPQFGGYCAYAMALGLLSSTDPLAWKVVDGRLYLVHSLAIEKVWQEDMALNIRLAEEHWPSVLYK
nr:YHS domain-containing (seleno)protein [uncultured Ruegeria sp.]